MDAINQSPNFSFELFPARTNEMRFQLGSTVTQLESLNPCFYSITHGAFENPGDSSDETIQAVQKLATHPVAAHIAASNAPKKEILSWAKTLYNDGIRHFVALRGDSFRRGDNQYFQSALEFTQALRHHFSDITIYVSAYPESHPDAKSADSELLYLNDKFTAGADKAITQFFFDVDKFYRWLDSCKSVNIHEKIIAGILPIVNYEKTIKMAEYCGTEIPSSLAYQYGKYIDDLESQARLSIDTTSELIDAIQCAGINDFHFYCLNRADVVSAICQNVKPQNLQQVAA